MKKFIGSQSSQSTCFVRLVSDIFRCFFWNWAKLKLNMMFNWKYIFVSTGLFWGALICFASCGSHFSSFFGYFLRGHFRKCVARSEKLVYDYYGLWLGKLSPAQKLPHLSHAEIVIHKCFHVSLIQNFVICLIFYHTITTSNNPEKESF